MGAFLDETSLTPTEVEKYATSQHRGLQRFLCRSIRTGGGGNSTDLYFWRSTLKTRVIWVLVFFFVGGGGMKKKRKHLRLKKQILTKTPNYASGVYSNYAFIMHLRHMWTWHATMGLYLFWLNQNDLKHLWTSAVLVSSAQPPKQFQIYFARDSVWKMVRSQLYILMSTISFFVSMLPLG